jgi:hypothetical protein
MTDKNRDTSRGKDRKSGSMPFCSNSNFTASLLDDVTANDSAVLPQLFFAVISAPSSSRASTDSSMPRAAANNNAVSPLLFLVSIGTCFCPSNIFEASFRRLLADSDRTVSPCSSVA